MHTSVKNLFSLPLIMLLIKINNGIHMCKDSDDVNAIFMSGPWTSHLVLAGQLSVREHYNGDPRAERTIRFKTFI